MNVAANRAVAPDRGFFAKMNVTDYLSTGFDIRGWVNLRVNPTKRSNHGLSDSNIVRSVLFRVDRCAKFAPMTRLVFSLGLLFTLALTTSCSGSLFKVKPATELPPLPANTRSADAGGVKVRVAPLLSDEESQELFEANLPLSGVLPLRVELAFQSGVPVEVKKAKFRLRDSQNREWKLLSPKSAISRIMKANGVRLYNPNSRKQFEREFTAYAIELKTPLSSSDSRRQGFLFFQTPDKKAVTADQQLTLTVERLPQTATITVN